jgi:hypothetical protein
MFPLVGFPELVQHYAPYFEDVFSAEAFIQFKRYISGLIVSEKTVDGINRVFVFESRKGERSQPLAFGEPILA